MKIAAIHIFFKDHGFRYCNKCFYSVGRVFIKDFNSKDCHHFQKKSIYKRSYHYQNKIEEINRKCDLNLSPEVYYNLRSDLEKIDNTLNKINDQYKRKRLINITYLIKRILGEYDKSEADKIQLKLSDKTLKFYDDLFNNIIQFLYYIFILLLREKTNIQRLSQIREMMI